MSEQQANIHETVAAGAAGIDPAYAEMLRRAQEVPESEEHVGRPDFPDSHYFVGNFDDFSFKQATFGSNRPPVPQVRISMKVAEGPEGSVGIHYSADLTLVVEKDIPVDFRNPKGARRPRTAEEVREAQDNLIGTGKKLRRILGLSSDLPETPTEGGVTAWLAQAKAMQPQVVFAGYSKNGFATLQLSSLRAPSDPAKHNKKLVQPPATALEFARKQLAEAAQKAGGPRRTLGGGTAAPSY